MQELEEHGGGVEGRRGGGQWKKSFISEAVVQERSNMRFSTVKTPKQRGVKT